MLNFMLITAQIILFYRNPQDICHILIDVPYSNHVIGHVTFVDSKVHGANMGSIWGRQVSPMLAPWTLLSG